MMAVVHANDGKVGDQKKIKAFQLPIYGPKKSVEDTPEAIDNLSDTQLTQNISKVRQQVWSAMDASKETTDMISQKCVTAKTHTKDLIHYIREDPGYLPRAGVITVAGLGGIVSGYKGGPFRKSIFALIGMGAASALCYPDQALDISKQAYTAAINHAKSMWEAPGKKKTDDATVIKPETKNITQTEPVTLEKVVNSKVDSSLLDHGQSKAEDKDMYTTRS